MGIVASLSAVRPGRLLDLVVPQTCAGCGLPGQIACEWCLQQLVTPTEKAVVGIGLADGKLLWRVPFAPRYNNNTPILDGQTVIFSGQGVGTVALAAETVGIATRSSFSCRRKRAYAEIRLPGRT